MTASRKLLDDCFLHDKDRLRHADVLSLLQDRIAPVAGTETVPLNHLAGRIVSRPIVAPRNVPFTDNAAVDGYAFAAADYADLGGWFSVADRIAAGHPRTSPMLPKTATRIFTGAVMPEGVDTIAMQEDCEPHIQDGQAFVAIPPGLKKGANCRKAGEDVLEGTTILMPGDRLTPQDIGAIASLGFAEADVHAPLRVALLSSGDELREPGADGFEFGQVFDSNAAMLRALLNPLPVSVEPIGILKDDRELVERKLAECAERFDLILSTGGASRGEEDHLIAALEMLGKRHVWQLAIKPGRPMSMGQINDCIMVGLPGNPVAAFVCFLLYVHPLILRLGGGRWFEPRRFMVPSGFAIDKKKPDRREFLRGILAEDGTGNTRVQRFSRDGSGLITGLREADGLIEIDEDTTSLDPDTPVPFLPFSQWY
jgi:molybdopterin molybdotransferase